MMSKKERERLVVMVKIQKQDMALTEAAELLDVSYRQTLRIHARYGEEGDAGLPHRSRGRPSNRAKGAKEKQAILERYQERYSGFGPTFAAEKLAADGYALDHETLRRWLMQAGLWPKRRRRSAHRQWRERKAHFGELVQMDGSPHRWFGPDGEAYCLLNMVDDARGVCFARFDGEETIELAMRTLWGWVERYGIPQALYVDYKNVYIPQREATREEELRGERPLTHFGRACQKLGIKIIGASSPQAKGRVERSNGVHQDRLVKELHLAGIQDPQRANPFLTQTYLPDYNTRFAVPARRTMDRHRPVPKGLDLRTVFCIEQERQVQKDWTLRSQNRYFQILKANADLPRPGATVVVSQWLDGSIHLLYKGHELKYKTLPERPEKPTPPKGIPRKPRKKYIPAPDHPWRCWNGPPRASGTR